jgi:(4S)-4-hydroxy-5-phosphonooxypentane-2,3-dione isomerase
MPNFILSGHIIVPESDLKAVREALPEHIEKTREEEGCLIFSVEEDSAKPGQFDVYEEFKNKAAFEFHQARLQATEWGQVSRNIKRHYKTNKTDY